MSMFGNLSKEPIAKVQNKQAEKWKEDNLLEKCVTTRKDKPAFIFYEGPPTANGKPGIHHVIARTLKDSVCRYKTMKGYQVKRKAGWDTHGLPVEIEVEKQLGLTDKNDIEKYGIAEFNEKCRESVFTYEKQWREMTKRVAYEVDLENPYITLENDFIETEWWILDQMNKAGLIYEGHKILPYCVRCGTGLASHEVALGYEEIKSLTVTVKFKRKDADEYFLVWTTTPWTLPSNVALTVHPEEVYAKVKAESGTVYIVAKALADTVLSESYEVLEEMKGSSLEYIEYEQLLPFVEPDKKAFFVTLADYVTTEDGTGIVHTAPAFGEDDYNTGVRYGLPVLQPVGEDGKFTETPWKGRFVMDTDLDVMKWLAENGKLYKRKKMAHNYPHCWRCKTPLLYYAKPSWYIKMTDLKDKLIENNNSVEWYPDYVGEKRFGNWLENLNDWAISRSRYWATPFPIWRCEECSRFDSIGSRKELVERAHEDIDESIELHRPYVDDVHITCPKCGERMTRVPDVIDCWFDSGSMPFSQHHYPFENKENFDELFPADYICEGIDQTRGWFYSLLAISTFVTGNSPYKRVLVNDLILDKHGKKMSKSRGNTVNPFELFDQYGADALRWYLLHVSPSWNPTKFDEDGLKEVMSKFFGTIKNVYTFFSLYANTDGVDPREFEVDYNKRPELDRWIISKMNNLIKLSRECMDEYDLTKVVREIQEFVNEDLSNWYIRRSRRRFWASGLSDDKKSVYSTTYEVLRDISLLIAPYAPYIAEELYGKLTGKTSVHLDYYPEYDESLIDDRTEKRMDLVRNLVKLGRASRDTEQIKVRQPLRKIHIDGKNEELIRDLAPLIKEELNIKEVVFEKNLREFMNFSLKPNFRVAGPKFGSKVKDFAKALRESDELEIINSVQKGGLYKLDLDGDKVEIDEELLDIRIDSKEGYNISMENNLFVILDTNLDEELINEGYAREFISKVQQMRKNNEYEMMDNIKIFYKGPEEIEKAVKLFEDYIKKETLAVEIINEKRDDFKTENLNGKDTGLKLDKIK